MRELIVLENDLTSLTESLTAAGFKVKMLPPDPSAETFEMIIADRIFLTKDPSRHGDKPAQLDTMTISVAPIAENTPDDLATRLWHFFEGLGSWRTYRARTIELLPAGRFRFIPITNLKVYRDKTYDLLWDFCEDICCIADAPRFRLWPEELSPDFLPKVLANIGFLLDSTEQARETHGGLYAEFFKTEVHFPEHERQKALVDAKERITPEFRGVVSELNMLKDFALRFVTQHPGAVFPEDLMERLKAFNPVVLLETFPNRKD